MLGRTLSILACLGLLAVASASAEAKGLRLRHTRPATSNQRMANLNRRNSEIPKHVEATVHHQSNISGKVTLSLERKGDGRQYFITARRGELKQGFVITHEGKVLEKTYVTKGRR